LISSGLLFSINYITNKNNLLENSHLSYTLRESMLDIPSYKKITKSRTSFILSGFILILIIGVWGLWS